MNETMQPRTGLWSLVECRQDSLPGQVFRIQGSDLVIGRSGDVQVTIDSSNVSKHHAKISFVDGCLMINDPGSTNGTFVNGRRVEHAAQTVTDRAEMLLLRGVLSECSMQLADDDFGAGQAHNSTGN